MVSFTIVYAKAAIRRRRHVQSFERPGQQLNEWWILCEPFFCQLVEHILQVSAAWRVEFLQTLNVLVRLQKVAYNPLMGHVERVSYVCNVSSMSKRSHEIALERATTAVTTCVHDGTLRSASNVVHACMTHQRVKIVVLSRCDCELLHVLLGRFSSLDPRHRWTHATETVPEMSHESADECSLTLDHLTPVFDFLASLDIDVAYGVWSTLNTSCGSLCGPSCDRCRVVLDAASTYGLYFIVDEM